MCFAWGTNGSWSCCLYDVQASKVRSVGRKKNGRITIISSQGRSDSSAAVSDRPLSEQQMLYAIFVNKFHFSFELNALTSYQNQDIDVEYIYVFVWWGVCKQSQWRHSVTEPSEDSGYVLLWQRYDNNKMVAMRYYGNVMTTTMSQYSDDVSSITHAGCICAPVNAITTCIYFTHRSDHTKTSVRR